MSRRPPNPGAERAAKNQQTIKSLLKLEANKVCADCKRNKHPRWASWNLGVFICIRCSGIHRGMGTHISRVKSVDLDAWTDEQLQSILSWGNARANKYWEAKLAAAHVPSESKIENFIRTKYELKRWVMEGPMPDPATLDVEGDDDIPLSVVKEKQDINRRESVRKASVGQSATPRAIPASAADLIGGDALPPRASTAGPLPGPISAKTAPAPPKTTNAKDSLLGLDFLGTEPSAPPRPASTTGTPGTPGMGGQQSRPDLKQSILSLYASTPKPQPQKPTQAPSGSFGGISSPAQNQSSFGGFTDAFSSLSFGNTAAPVAPAMAPASPRTDAFSGLGNFSSTQTSPKPNNPAFAGLSGGSFFDAKPAQAAPSHQPKQSVASPGGFGGFASMTPAAPAPKPPAQTNSSGLGDLFDFSSPSAAAPPQSTISSPPLATTNSVFNLSAPNPEPAPAAAPVMPAMASTPLSNSDLWGGGNVWGSAETKKSPEVANSSFTVQTNDFGWGQTEGSLASQPIVPGASGGFSLANQPIVPGASGGFAPAPKVAADEEFGGWTSSTGPTAGGTGTTPAAKPASGFGASEDLFSNVWQ